MFLKNINLKNFRNYSFLEFEFKKNKTLFTGKNAQGKTNLLEAVYYLSSLDSTRIRKDLELIKFNETMTNIKGTVNKGDIDIDLEVLINPPKNKIIKVNGIKKNKHKDFIRVLSVVSFSSQDLSLLRGEPSDRRKWLDLAISQVYPQYFDKLAKFNKIRLQKANYLSNFNISKEMLDVFNEQFAIANSNIVYLRMKYLNEIKEKAINYAAEHKVEKSVIMTVTGAVNCKIDYNMLEKEADADMCTVFEETRKEGEAKAIIELGFEFGLSEEEILDRLQKKLNISLQKAQEYFSMFAKKKVIKDEEY